MDEVFGWLARKAVKVEKKDKEKESKQLYHSCEEDSITFSGGRADIVGMPVVRKLFFFDFAITM